MLLVDLTQTVQAIFTLLLMNIPLLHLYLLPLFDDKCLVNVSRNLKTNVILLKTCSRFFVSS
jgi:hypothetical protein